MEMDFSLLERRYYHMNNMTRSDSEHKYTSTGIKFWCHEEQMKNYKDGNPNTIISTHISPEGRCNLLCDYCSVTHRKVHHRIELDTIKRYITTLKKYGLKAVIVTGGGEPTLYPHINDLLVWLKDQNLDVGMINNGTQTNRVKHWDLLSWVRVSLNIFNDWENKITFPMDEVSEDCIVGGSFVYTNQNMDTMKRVSDLANKIGFKYVRILPNCLLEQGGLINSHNELDEMLVKINNPIFFHQQKLHATPNTEICHQSFFRPYLSEANGGTVYPCDSVVLNDAIAEFSEKYAICLAEDVEKYILGEIKPKFKPCDDCSGCVFETNIMMLDKWKNDGIPTIVECNKMNHRNFV